MLETAVLISDALDGKGGASLVALQSAKLLAEAGVSVRLFGGLGPSAIPEQANLRVETLRDGEDLVTAPIHVRAVRSLWNTEAADRFARTVQDLDPQRTVVHVHSFQFQLTASVIRRAADLGFPLAMTAHDYGLACPYSGFFNYNAGRPCGKRALSVGCAATLCNESRNVAGKLWHVGKGWLQAGKGHVPRALRHIAFVSEFSREILAPYLHQAMETSVVRNPIEIPPCSPRSPTSNAPFLFVGRLTREKGAEIFARAAREAGVPAVFIGTGEREAAIRTANPDARMLGWQGREEVVRRMREARALVFPSVWYEGQPLAVQEAQAVGLPVLVAKGTAATEMVLDGLDGRHFDPDHLAPTLRDFTDEDARQMGLAAHARFWADPPTPARHVEDTLAMYRSILMGAA